MDTTLTSAAVATLPAYERATCERLLSLAAGDHVQCYAVGVALERAVSDVATIISDTYHSTSQASARIERAAWAAIHAAYIMRAEDYPRAFQDVRLGPDPEASGARYARQALWYSAPGGYHED